MTYLRSSLEIEGQNVLSMVGFTLSNEENAVPLLTPVQHKNRRHDSTERTMKPRIHSQGVILTR